MSDILTTMYVELHQCPSHQSILLAQGPTHEIFTKKFEDWRFWKTTILKHGHFRIFSPPKKNCMIPMKISHKLCDIMDGTLFWCFPWFPAKLLLCIILHYTVYIELLWALPSKNVHGKAHSFHDFWFLLPLGLESRLLSPKMVIIWLHVTWLNFDLLEVNFWAIFGAIFLMKKV